MGANLKNKTILITGATDGLGKLTALELAKLGANIIIHGRNSQKVDVMLLELRMINPSGTFSAVVADFNKPAEIQKAFGYIKEIDILINNAGTWLEGNTIDAAQDRIIELSNVDLASHMVATRLMLPLLKKSEFGQILNVVSIAGVEIPFDYYHSIYSAVKFGMQGFTESLVKEFSNTNVRVMGFYPGGMETGLFKKAGCDYLPHEDWMFDPIESVEAMIFMLTRNKKVNIKRMDLINHLQV